jgi:hypothetical protein
MAKEARKNGHNISSDGHNGIGKAAVPANFGNSLISTIPHGRKGKHNLIVSMILDDLDRLDLEKAVVVPLESLEGEKMENVRSALNRATRQRNMAVATATDEKYFYVWRTEQEETQPIAPNGVASHTNRQR